MSHYTSGKAESNSESAAAVIVSVCTACRLSADEETRIGARLIEALRPVVHARAPDVHLRAVHGLGVSKRPSTIAISGSDRYTFVFGDLDPQTCLEAVVSFAQAYSILDYGFVPWIARPELLRSRLVARIPSVTWSPEDGHPPA